MAINWVITTKSIIKWMTELRWIIVSSSALVCFNGVLDRRKHRNILWENIVAKADIFGCFCAGITDNNAMGKDICFLFVLKRKGRYMADERHDPRPPFSKVLDQYTANQSDKWSGKFCGCADVECDHLLPQSSNVAHKPRRFLASA